MRLIVSVSMMIKITIVVVIMSNIARIRAK